MMTKETFNQISQEFKNARNTIAGIFNSKESFNSTLAKQLKYYAYRIMDSIETPEQQILRLSNLGFNTPWAVISPELNTQLLENILQQRKINAPYDIDGLVIYQNSYVEYPNNENPKNVIPFKMQTEIAETTVAICSG